MYDNASLLNNIQENFGKSHNAACIQNNLVKTPRHIYQDDLSLDAVRYSWIKGLIFQKESTP